MDKKLFLERVAEALRAEPGSIQEGNQLQKLEGWDSIGALSVIALIDEHYGITVEAQELADCRTVADLVALVEKDR
jgi:acyl carrier protein